MRFCLRFCRFVVPPSFTQGVYEFVIYDTTPNGKPPSASTYLNLPQPWWIQPNSAPPGSAVRVFGKSLAPYSETAAAASDHPVEFSSASASDAEFARRVASVSVSAGAERGHATEAAGVRVRFKNKLSGSSTTVMLDAAKANQYSLSLSIPASLAAGSYSVEVHNGYVRVIVHMVCLHLNRFGGDAAWATCPDPLTVTAAPKEWPTKIFNVEQLGFEAAVAAVRIFPLSY